MKGKEAYFLTSASWDDSLVSCGLWRFHLPTYRTFE